MTTMRRNRPSHTLSISGRFFRKRLPKQCKLRTRMGATLVHGVELVTKPAKGFKRNFVEWSAMAGLSSASVPR